MPRQTETAIDPIVDLQRRVVQAARERAVFHSLNAADAAAELKAAKALAAALGEQLRSEQRTRTGVR